MTELLISEITRMRRGLCVIGLEPRNGHYRSVRPIPPHRNAWMQFPYRRGDRIVFELYPREPRQPHIEDRDARNRRKVGAISEPELVNCLRRAETAASVKGLFECEVHPSPHGGPSVYANPTEAKRSICGCEINSIRFSFRFFPEAIRATLALKSGETLDLPVVDFEWRELVDRLARQLTDQADVRWKLQHFFDSFVRVQLMSSLVRFARIGISRPERDGLCWLMLDSLFPLPKDNWAEMLG